MQFESNKRSTLASGAISPKVSAKQLGSKLLIWKIVALVMGLCFVTVVILGAVLLFKVRESNCPDVRTVPDDPQIPDISNGVLDGSRRIIERVEWGAQPPTELLDKLKLPVPYVVISQTSTDFCKTQTECTFRVRFAQTFHIESRGWSDIAYNLLVGGDGNAYVGRGWDYVGAHTYNYNARSIGISFIGTFNTVLPPAEQLFAAQKLIDLGVKYGKISPDYKLLAHRQVASTLSPGDALYNVVKTWPHWDNFTLM